MRNTTARKYGWKPDLPDQRDFIFRTVNAAVPDKIDPRPHTPAVLDQGQEGSCTGHGACYITEAIEIDASGMSYTHLSRAFPYYNARLIEGTTDQDSGAQIRDAVKGLATYGNTTAHKCGYHVGGYAKKPTQSAYDDALSRKITAYHRVTTGMPGVCEALAAGLHVIFGFSVYESFESQATADTGVVTMPGPREQLLGGHCCTLWGYDMATNRALGLNEWGASWGDHGWFYMPFDYINNRGLVSDIWAIQK